MEDLAALLNNAEAIEDGDARYEALLSDLQCNILSGHGRKEARYFFVRFDDLIKAKYLCGMLPRNPVERAMVFTTEDAGTLEKLPQRTRDSLVGNESHHGGPWLLSKEDYQKIENLMLASERSVRAGNQWRKEQRRGGGSAAVCDDPSDFAINFLLTARGYAKLTDEPLPPDPSFRQGMADRGKVLNDPDPASEDWDKTLIDIDALLIVAYDPCTDPKKKEVQDAALKVLELALRKHGGLVGDPQVGRNLTVKLEAITNGAVASDKDVAIEPFGFRDAISQPVFYSADVAEMERRGVVRAALPKQLDQGSGEAQQARERARRAAYAPLALALCPDPNGKTRHACGSYFVFRKLGQNIEKFYEQVDHIAEVTERSQEDVLADLMGRRRDGTPLLAEAAEDIKAGINTFDFRDDDDGKLCPFHSHVRKVNPRGDLADARAQRIVRRGIPYGPMIERDASGKPVREGGKIRRQGGSKPRKNDIGLLFLCAQSSIEKQFERIQVDWANNPNFSWGKLPGADTIVGQRPPNEENRIRVRHNDNEKAEREFVHEPVVALCGGDYFFAPSISFLRGLHDGLWK